MKLQESGENYLETILMLHQRTGFVRSIDVATELGFTKPSVSRAMSILKEAGYIAMGKGGQLLLTESGLARAGAVLERHHIISCYLSDILGVDPETAEQDACRVEHVISVETFDAIKKAVNASSSKENVPGRDL